MKENSYTKEEVKKQHEYVKSHFWREDFGKQYKADYTEALYKLKHMFYFHIAEFFPERKNGAGNMSHDFSYSIRNIHDSGCLYHIERCIGTIHQYLDTGEFNEYWDYYTGCNIPPGVERATKHVWNGEKFVSFYTRAEAEIYLNSKKDAYAEALTRESKEYADKWYGDSVSYWEEFITNNAAFLKEHKVKGW